MLGAVLLCCTIWTYLCGSKLLPAFIWLIVVLIRVLKCFKQPFFPLASCAEKRLCKKSQWLMECKMTFLYVHEGWSHLTGLLNELEDGLSLICQRTLLPSTVQLTHCCNSIKYIFYTIIPPHQDLIFPMKHNIYFVFYWQFRMISHSHTFLTKVGNP